jgi:hypothetical protein
MGKEWIGIIGVIVGGTITFLVTYLKQKNDEKIKKKELYLQKLEELHEVLTNVIENYKTVSMWAIHWLVHGHIHDREAQSFKESYIDYKKLPIVKLRMLIGIYAFILKNDLLRIVNFDKDFDKVVKKSFHAKTSEEKKQLREIIESKTVKIENICIELQDKVVLETQKYL